MYRLLYFIIIIVVVGSGCDATNHTTTEQKKQLERHQMPAASCGHELITFAKHVSNHLENKNITYTQCSMSRPGMCEKITIKPNGFVAYFKYTKAEDGNSEAENEHNQQYLEDRIYKIPNLTNACDVYLCQLGNNSLVYRFRRSTQVFGIYGRNRIFSNFDDKLKNSTVTCEFFLRHVTSSRLLSNEDDGIIGEPFKSKFVIQNCKNRICISPISQKNFIEYNDL